MGTADSSPLPKMLRTGQVSKNGEGPCIPMQQTPVTHFAGKARV